MRKFIMQLAGIILIVFAKSAGAEWVYEFNGECTAGCNGAVEFTLVLEDSYIPGTGAGTTSDDKSPFISWKYSSDVATDGRVAHDEAFYSHYSLGTNEPLTDLSFYSNHNCCTFELNVSASEWAIFHNPGVQPGFAFFFSGTTTSLELHSVPIPASAFMFGSSLIGILLVRRNK